MPGFAQQPKQINADKIMNDTAVVSKDVSDEIAIYLKQKLNLDSTQYKKTVSASNALVMKVREIRKTETADVKKREGDITAAFNEFNLVMTGLLKPDQKNIYNSLKESLRKQFYELRQEDFTKPENGKG